MTRPARETGTCRPVLLVLLLRKMSLLVINSGSSSLKFQLLGRPDRPVAQGQVTGIGADLAHVEYQMDGDAPARSACKCPTYREAVRTALHLLTAYKDIQAVGHRLLVGFPRFQESILLDERTDSISREIWSTGSHDCAT